MTKPPEIHLPRAHETCVERTEDDQYIDITQRVDGETHSISLTADQVPHVIAALQRYVDLVRAAAAQQEL